MEVLKHFRVVALCAPAGEFQSAFVCVAGVAGQPRFARTKVGREFKGGRPYFPLRLTRTPRTA